MAVALVATLAAQPAEAAALQTKTIEAWESYIRHTEERIEKELASEDGFLVLDFQPPREAAAARAAALRGEVVVAKIRTSDAAGRNITVPGGMIHHWRATVFIPDVSLQEILSRVQYPEVDEHRQEDVLESRVLSRDEEAMRIFLKLVRKKIVTVTYNTEHLVKYRTHDESRVSSRSVATKIAELENANTPAEREKPIGQDHGFLWRLNSYWRYEETAGGVLVELESATLSRSVPILFKPFVMPMISSVAKESMKRTLDAMRIRFSNLPLTKRVASSSR
jgi:hypothetical protein